MGGLRRVIRSLTGTTTPIYPGHRYQNEITGERFDVGSVGRQVTVDRLDADRRPNHTVDTETFRDAIDAGIVTHDDGCPACTNSDDVSSR